MVAVKVDVVCDVITIVVCTITDPEASANRPVPPVMMKVTVSWNTVGPAGHETPLPETNNSSPFAAVIVSFSVPTKPSHVDWPVTVVVPTRFDLPR